MVRDSARVKILLPQALLRDWKVAPVLEVEGKTLAEAFVDLNAASRGWRGRSWTIRGA